MIIFVTISLIGQILCTIAGNAGIIKIKFQNQFIITDSFLLMLLGRILNGIGNENTAVSYSITFFVNWKLKINIKIAAIASKWFKADKLALVLSIGLFEGKIFGFLS